MLPPKKTIPVCNTLVPIFLVMKSSGREIRNDSKIPKINATAAWLTHKTKAKKVNTNK